MSLAARATRWVQPPSDGRDRVLLAAARAQDLDAVVVPPLLGQVQEEVLAHDLLLPDRREGELAGEVQVVEVLAIDNAKSWSVRHTRPLSLLSNIMGRRRWSAVG